ncbi:MAG: hypothetical protein NVS3B28_02350 [Candidatus Velthaea sp.]
MKRTPPLLALLAVAVQFAGIGLCVWAMSWHAKPYDADEADPVTPPEQPTAESPMPPGPAVHAWTEPPLPPRMTVIPMDLPAGPKLVAPPPASGALPPYILELAERTTQIVRGFVDGSWLTFGFYPDGNIRMVDVDGGHFEGRAVSARAHMKEAGGTRSFNLHIGVASDGRLQAKFGGGAHDGQTLVLEAIAERPVS